MSIVDVAKLAGLSHTTVSRVINHQPGVSASTVKKVQQAMRQLGYTPPARRRGPQPRHRRNIRTGNIALLMFGTDAAPMIAPVAAAVTHYLEEHLGRHDLNLSIGQVKSDGRIPSAVANGRVDGLILHGRPPSPEVAAKLMRFPSVWIMSPRSRTGYWGDRVCPDNSAIGRIAAEYLIGRGHDRISMLEIETAHLGFRERAMAFCETAEEHNVSTELITVPDQDDSQAQGSPMRPAMINALIDRFVALEDRPSGLFVPLGQATLAVYEALRMRGIEPGGQVTVVACDNDPTLAGLNPRLATVDVRPDRIGQLAVEQLLLRMDKASPHARTQVLVEPSLVTPPVPEEPRIPASEITTSNGVRTPSFA
ncbi:LacI family DNA-binding transcriptional regulator [Mucisphaera calidilacus]|uniref:Putative HTH-type transcriptional repressor ExuR n=1 Tax=Mucisphaera calidilacus TaxID=2527982 RepID=A0A518BUT1_9BACT|nr:LacI family DNA-binding transcriptional regulator [Mucisphaera calidilacus]QDU70740.1 putative HTH-type transcriptional repressor ExuR [Mucisphaera calidilacus]